MISNESRGNKCVSRNNRGRKQGLRDINGVAQRYTRKQKAFWCGIIIWHDFDDKILYHY